MEKACCNDLFSDWIILDPRERADMIFVERHLGWTHRAAGIRIPPIDIYTSPPMLIIVQNTLPSNQT